MVSFLRPPFLRTTPRSSSGRSTRQLALVAVALVALLGFTSLLVQTQQDSWTSPSTAPSSSSPSHSWLSDMGIGEGWGGVGWLGDKLGLTSGGGAAAAAAEAERDRPGRDVLQGSKRWDEEGSELWNMPERLKDDEHYLVTGHIAGWTNQVMASIDTIHLAIETNRTPIIPFYFGYISQLGGDELCTPPLINLAYRQIFNLPLLFHTLKSTPYGASLRGIVDSDAIVEINRDVENGGRGWPEQLGRQADGLEGEWMEMGCWNAHGRGIPRPMRMIRINPHYTELPPLVMPIKPHPNFPGLSTLLSTSTSNASFTHLLESVNATSRSSVVPDRRLTCIDSMYYTTTSSKENLSDLWSKLSSSGGEIGFADGPWLTVGRHLRWTDDLLEKGEWAARRIWGLEEGERRPPFISVHIRHGDFLKHCTDTRPCYPLSAFAEQVSIVQKRLFSKTGVNVTNVLVGTDETDPAFFADVRARGWKWVEEDLSLAIRREWGDWYPMLLDNVLLSMGSGFVGTTASTMSIINARRVQDWNGGLAAYVDRYAAVKW